MYPQRNSLGSSNYVNLQQPVHSRNVTSRGKAVMSEDHSTDNDVPPPLPRRPNATASAMFQSPYSSGFGSMYGNSYQDFLHGNPGYGYPSYGFRGNMVQNRSLINGVEGVTQHAFQSVESVIQAISSISMVLESTLFAVQNSIRAIVSVADQFSNLRLHMVTSCISFLRIIRYYARKLLILFKVRHPYTDDHLWDEAVLGASVAAPKDSKHWTIIVFFAVVIGTPWLVWKLLRSIITQRDIGSAWQKGNGEHFLAEVKFSFQSENNDELSITAGDMIKIAPRDRQPQVRGWLLASDGEKQGIVPANYIKILGKNRPSAENQLQTEWSMLED